MCLLDSKCIQTKNISFILLAALLSLRVWEVGNKLSSMATRTTSLAFLCPKVDAILHLDRSLSWALRWAGAIKEEKRYLHIINNNNITYMLYFTAIQCSLNTPFFLKMLSHYRLILLSGTMRRRRFMPVLCFIKLGLKISASPQMISIWYLWVDRMMAGKILLQWSWINISHILMFLCSSLLALIKQYLLNIYITLLPHTV